MQSLRCVKTIGMFGKCYPSVSQYQFYLVIFLHLKPYSIVPSLQKESQSPYKALHDLDPGYHLDLTFSYTGFLAFPSAQNSPPQLSACLTPSLQLGCCLISPHLIKEALHELLTLTFLNGIYL